MSRALRRRYGRSRSMSWGVVPPYKTFLQQIRKNDPETGTPYLAKGQMYPIEAHAGSGDARALKRAGFKPVGYGAYGKELWRLTDKQLYALIKHGSDHGPSEDGEGIGDFASSIMTTLGYEWV